MYKYKIEMPKHVSSDTPVVVTLHGMGSNYDDLKELVPLIVGETITIHLQGDLQFGSGFAFFIPNFTEQSEENIIGSVIKQTYQTISTVINNNNFVGHPIYLIGFSQGAIIGTGLINVYPNFLTKAWLFSGRIPTFIAQIGSKLSQKMNTDVFVSQGISDQLFPPTVGQNIAKVMAPHVRNLVYQEYVFGHGIHQDAINDAKKILEIKK